MEDLYRKDEEEICEKGLHWIKGVIGNRSGES